MPIYDYRCTACAHRFELRQTFADDAGAACPQCGEPCLRVMHPVGIVFKGSGWHSTDYRSASRSGGTDKGEPSSESKSESSGDGKSEKKSESSSDGKSERKSETKKDSEAPAASASATSSTSSSSSSSSD